MERQEGYYWVKYKGDWKIAYYSAEHFCFWGISGEVSLLIEFSFEVINETRIPSPDEVEFTRIVPANDEGHTFIDTGMGEPLNRPNPPIDFNKEGLVLAGVELKYLLKILGVTSIEDAIRKLKKKEIPEPVITPIVNVEDVKSAVNDFINMVSNMGRMKSVDQTKQPTPNYLSGVKSSDTQCEHIAKVEHKDMTIIDLLNCKELPPIFKTRNGYNVDLNRLTKNRVITTDNTDLSDVHTMD